MLKMGGKKGQVTIFVIIAILIIGGLIIFFAATDVGKRTLENFTQTGEFDVIGNLKTCIEENEKINDDIIKILSQGGNLNPEFSYMFGGVELSYLCYTSEDYETCINQEPVLVGHVENEIHDVIKPEINSCIQSLRKQLSDRNYNVNAGNLITGVNLTEGNIIINIGYPLTISKDDSTKSFEGFQIRKKSKAYSLITLSTSIINFEARYGDSDPNTYMLLYPQIRVEKLKQGDGTTIYKVSDRSTEESFNFAVRSLVFPPGYDL